MCMWEKKRSKCDSISPVYNMAAASASMCVGVSSTFFFFLSYRK